MTRARRAARQNPSGKGGRKVGKREPPHPGAMDSTAVRPRGHGSVETTRAQVRRRSEAGVGDTQKRRNGDKPVSPTTKGSVKVGRSLMVNNACSAARPEVQWVRRILRSHSAQSACAAVIDRVRHRGRQERGRRMTVVRGHNATRWPGRRAKKGTNAARGMSQRGVRPLSPGRHIRGDAAARSERSISQ